MFRIFLFVLICTPISLLSAEQCPEPLDFINNSCVGENVYYNITQKWEPRLSEIEGWVIQVLPIILTIVIAMLYLINTKPGLRKLVREIKKTYQEKTLYIYFKAWFGEGLFNCLTNPGEMEPTHPHYSLSELRNEEEKELGYS